MELRNRYGNENVVAGYIPGAEPKGELKESGPSAVVDVTDAGMIESVVKEYNIDTIYNLAALLSVVAESKPKLAWKIGIDGLWNVLETARIHGCAVFTPSSIGSFGADTPHTKTPQDTIQRPRTMYGISKVTTELLSDYYHNKYGVDTRAVRFPGSTAHATNAGPNRSWPRSTTASCTMPTSNDGKAMRDDAAPLSRSASPWSPCRRGRSWTAGRSTGWRISWRSAWENAYATSTRASRARTSSCAPSCSRRSGYARAESRRRERAASQAV